MDTFDDENTPYGDRDLFGLDIIVLEEKIKELSEREGSVIEGNEYLNEKLVEPGSISEGKSPIDPKPYFSKIKGIFERIKTKEEVLEEELIEINAPNYIFRICGYDRPLESK